MKIKVFWLIFFVMLLFVICFLCFFLYERLSFPIKFEEEITNASDEFNVDKNLIASVINAESHFNKNALSNKGAVGLMQIMPSTADWLIDKLVREKGYILNDDGNAKSIKYVSSNNKYLYDEKTNITLGSFYLSYLLKKFNNLDVCICAYNAGEGVVSKWLDNSEYSSDGKTLKKIPYSETRNYLKKVKLNLKVYTNKF